MQAAEKNRANLAEFSRCEDPAWLSVEEQYVDRKTVQANENLAEKVDRALWDIGVLRSTDYREIEIAVRDGVVYLGGHVISTGNQQKAEDAALTTQGVLGVKSFLVSDDQLRREVAGALGEIEHVHGVKFFTGTQNGVIVLNGEVGSSNIRLLAEKCAASIPAVRGVINYVRSPDVDLKSEDHRFLQPAVGKQIYFRDGLPGMIQKVIINPNNRRVVAMIVRGRFSALQQDPRFQAYGEDQVPERLIVIPMSAVRFLTKYSGYLNIDSSEAASYRDFNRSDFATPRGNWTPPYPYCPDDIFFSVEPDEYQNLTESEPEILPASLPLFQPAELSGT